MATVLADIVVCPRDHLPLSWGEESVVCEAGHRYPLVEGIPVLLVGWDRPTLRSAYQGTKDVIDGKLPAESVKPVGTHVDTWVQNQIVATCGRLWTGSRGRLKEYPIPQFPHKEGTGLLLDLGCNWGRWSVAAARVGFSVVGLDPSLPALIAAKRVASDLQVTAYFVVGDARCLPFAAEVFDQVFSYSVLQHFSKANVSTSLAEIRRVLRTGGISMIQMPNKLGGVSLYHQLLRGFRTARGFEVRYWSQAELRTCFEKHVGPTSIAVDGFLGLGVGAGTGGVLEGWRRHAVLASAVLKRIARRLRPLGLFADSVFVRSVKTDWPLGA